MLISSSYLISKTLADWLGCDATLGGREGPGTSMHSDFESSATLIFSVLMVYSL